MKKIIAIVLTLMVMLSVCACGTVSETPKELSIAGFNYQLFDTKYSFKYAVIQRYDGEQLIELKSWRDFEDGDQIQITSVDGITYLLHSSQVILMSDKER